MGRRQIARTSREPGKTRTVNVFNVADTFYLVDLPGYGYARVSRAERQRFRRLIERYLTARDTLAGALWLLDARRDPSPDDRWMATMLTATGAPVLAAITKADKLPRGRRLARARAIVDSVGLPEDQCVVTSAETKEGVPQLRQAIEQLVAEARRDFAP